ncbi:probable WRKY transcription factor 53 [Dendrobium catenatum]|uniref:probable WRKY transcription factor 53 n=1 Tax=Dendrobium catenatum TaxID=906689 RepID=UPI00109F6E30|nr:probable WRKY transcription factor 53 [Dendrobium catenatum]
MEKSHSEDLKMLIDVLREGNGHVMELEAHLYNYETFSSETCLLLSSKLQSTFATAIAIIKLMEQRGLPSPPPSSATDSPRSQSSERSFKEQERREMCKKRKSLPRWSEQVKACSGSAMEIPLDDGHSWRKYGQKDILGAKFPRCYYRCTYRHSHGCVATKQIQRSDNNSSLFDITYRGAHTCNHGFQKPSPLTNEQIIHQNQSIKVKTEALSSNEQKSESSPYFSFPLTPKSCLKLESNVFSSSSNPENYEGLDLEIADIICASNSTTSSEMLKIDFGVEQFVFDSEFSFDFY